MPIRLSTLEEEEKEKKPVRLSDVVSQSPEERQKGTFLEEAGRKFVRFQRDIPLAAVAGDIPFLGKEFRDIEPETGFEKFQFGATRFTRDIATLGKLTPLKGLPFLAGAGAFGAATSGTEDPKEIAKHAGLTAAGFKLFDVGARFLPKALTAGFKKLPKEGPKFLPFIGKDFYKRIGKSLGTSLSKIPFVDKLKFARNGEIFEHHANGKLFTEEMNLKLTLPQRQALVFMREKTGVPKKLPESKEIIKVLRDPQQREGLKDFSNRLGRKYDEWHKDLMQTYGDDVGFVENYINRIWDIPKKRKKEIANWFMTRPKHLKQRFIGTIQEGVNKKGLTPKTLDSAKLFDEYNNLVATTKANFNFLKGYKVKNPITGKSKRVPGLLDYRTSDGTKAILRIDKAPAGWPTIDHPVLRRAMGFKTKKGSLGVQKVPVAVHPEIAEEMKTLFGGKLEHEFIKSVEGINAWAKHSQLALSLFHHVALGEAAIATGTLNPRLIGKIFREMKAGKSPVLHDPNAKLVVKEFGVSLHAPTDVHRNAVEASIFGAVEGIKKLPGGKILSKPVEALQKAITTNNRFLWDYYHPNLKIYSTLKLYQDALKSPTSKGKSLEAIKKEVGQFVNDTFGGQNMVLMTRSPQWQQGMHLALLSPDWNLSTVRQALSPFQVGARDKATAELRAELGQEFWKASGVVIWAGINNLNRAFTKFHLGEERNMWENDTGRETNLFVGFNKDGSKRWLRWGKQFRELPEFFMNPVKKTAGKLSPVIQAARQQIDPFPHGAIKKAEGQFGKQNVERIKQLVTSVGIPPIIPAVPFSVQSQVRKREFNPLAMAFPFSGTRGSAYFNTLREFKNALRTDDMNKIKKLHRSALENGLNSEAILRRAAGDLEYEQTQAKKQADDVFFELLSMPRDQWQAHIAAQNLDDKALKRLRRLMKERLKSERLLENINTQGISTQRLESIIKR
jgi:hypothetical protein